MGLFGTKWTPLQDLGKAVGTISGAVGNVATNLVSPVVGTVGSVVGSVSPLVTNVANSQLGATFGASLGSGLTGGAGLLSGGAASNPFSGLLGGLTGGGKAAPIVKEATFMSKLTNINKLKDPAYVTANGKEYFNYDYDVATGKTQIDYLTVAWKGTVVLLAVYGIYKFGKKKRWF